MTQHICSLLGTWRGPSHPEEEEELISLGYEVLSLYMGPTELCINVSQQTWASALPLKEDFWTLLELFTTLSLSMSHVYTTKTLGKELRQKQRTLCKGFTNKNFKYIHVHWDKYQAKSGKLMFMANHTIVDWGPHGIWLSNCSDDINNTIYDYII